MLLNRSFSGIATFTNQIEIGGSSFSSGGDSGSLVTTTGTCPQAVGLLFVGGSSATFANPIGNVLTALNVSMVGGCSAASAAPIAGASPTSAALPGAEVQKVASVAAVKSRHEAELMKIPGVLGAGVGLSPLGTPVVKVFVEEDTFVVRSALPPDLEGVPVQIEETGPIVAY